LNLRVRSGTCTGALDLVAEPLVDISGLERTYRLGELHRGLGDDNLPAPEQRRRCRIAGSSSRTDSERGPHRGFGHRTDRPHVCA
jgi:hypothetical protein